MKKLQKRLGELLIQKGLIHSGQLKDALDEQQKTKEFLGWILIKSNKIKEADLLEALSEQFNIPFISIKYKYIDWDFVKRFTSSLILDYKCFPIQRNDDSVTVAITNPLDVWVLKKAEEETKGVKLKLVFVSREDMNDAIQRYKEYVRRRYL